ncbi:hypothetical protein Bbelb_371680 [Branchiostoma belcheri]|nr:hypothetical protein Bbelb_371680 [Branchiostoma belcheri]
MKLTRDEAYKVLELPLGADGDSIRTSYKRLALKWHPDKHANDPEATKKFQEVSAAYKRLSAADDDDSDFEMSPQDMFDLFARIFMASRLNMFVPLGGFNPYNGHFESDSSDYTSDDGDTDILNIMADKIKQRVDARRFNKQPDVGRPAHRLTEDQARKNAEELIAEEEKRKKAAEKRRAKKKRRKEKKRQEKEKQGKEDIVEPEEEEDIDDPDDADSKKSFHQTDKILANGKVESSTKNPNGDSRNKKKKKDSKRVVEESSSSEEEEPFFDPNSAFVANAAKKSVQAAAASSSKSAGPSKKEKAVNGQDRGRKEKKDQEEETIEELDPVVLKSRQIAVRGNEMANHGHYGNAVELFTAAIKLDPSDFRFFGNRSYCFDRMGLYDKALSDAGKAIDIAPDWPKGYFRKGRALAGLKLFADAERAFEKVLKLDRNCEDAMQELLRVRTQQLMEMGFSRQQSEHAIRVHGTVQAALDSLLAGVVQESSLSQEVYLSDEEFDHYSNVPTFTEVLPSGTARAGSTKPPVDGVTALWVGNVLPKVKEEQIRKLFKKYGEITSVRMLSDRYCCFVNFRSKDAADLAMKGLQGHELEGQHLLIKYPDNPIVNGQRTTVLRKTNIAIPTTTPATSTATVKPTSTLPQQPKPKQPANNQKAQGNKEQQREQQQSRGKGNPAVQVAQQNNMRTQQHTQALELDKKSGPVKTSNGNECYFWRTTGCHFGDRCIYQHIPESKGCEKKPWHK